MHKQVIKSDVPETGGPFNLCVRHGDMIYISGLPPFDAEFSAQACKPRAPTSSRSRRSPTSRSSDRCGSSWIT